MYNYFLFFQSGKKFQENKITTTTTTKSSKKTNSSKEPNKKNKAGHVCHDPVKTTDRGVPAVATR